MATKPSAIYGDQLKKANSISDLKRSMHILWWRPQPEPVPASIGYYHHALVTEVRMDEQSVTIIHLTGADVAKAVLGVEQTARIVEELMSWKHMDVDNLYYLHYDPDQCLRDDDVITNARHLRGENVKYDLTENNCETFAGRCKTGKDFSAQAMFVVKTVQAAISESFNVPQKSVLLPESDEN